MSFKVSANRLRHVVNILSTPTGSDAYGDPLPSVVVVQDMFCEVQVKSGDQNASYNTELTSEVLTILSWTDDRVNNNHTVEWKGNEYVVRHIRHSTDDNGMIITATREFR